MTPAVAGQVPERDQRHHSTFQLTWRTYTVKDEEFSVDLPNTPLMTSSVILHPRTLKAQELKTFVNGIIYTIDVYENPEPKQSLEDFITEQNAISNFKLTPKQDLVVSGFRGKQYVFRDKPRFVTVQFFITENRLYRFAAAGADTSDAAVKQFLSSIRLVKPINATEVPDASDKPLVLDTGERIYTGKEVTTKARLISKPEPLYTEEARRNRISGMLILRVIFSKTGEVTNIQVLVGLPYGMTERAIDAARGIKFVPATKDGNPVSMWMQLEYIFYL